MGITRAVHVISGAVLTGALVISSAPNATADQIRDDQWVLNALDAESIWKTTKGKGQTVAVIDDGVNADHPDLIGNVLKGKDFIDGGSTAPAGGQDHGTAMAGIIAAHGHGPGNGDGVVGLAPEAKILPIRDLGRRQDGYATSIRYAVDHGASVINISQAGETKLDGDGESEAISYALKRNVVIVAGTGNDGGPVGYPAAYPGVVAAGGLNNDGSHWDNSNRGKQTMLSAPASKVVSTGGKANADAYRIGTGTSDATAYTSASVALVKAKYPDLTAGQVVNRLTKTAEMPASEKGTKLPDERYGYGAIRPLAALQEDIPKGSKYGPLSVPQQIKNEEKAAEKERESKTLQEQADQKMVIAWSVIGVLILVVVLVIVLLVVRSRRKRNRNNGSGGPGAPGAYPIQPGSAPGYGQPPHQQGPYAPQPTAPPQQPPYN
ncbi:type VII secretion-associated serine protease mycosin [Streptomyces sp. WMMB 322]|uniref:type VII secretion-associated serine protease mycosin n=1 Tax=Streptomyces sp. WMMB 322 TaxID=1286821 RepID=UPI0006E23E00|nr:type VII secretion-associated serine protease mycosin [Streptomyces sp. WMMB 322]SCK20865.1 type VII secretion-associated serine protease mycosin [Streptomyces sp. WMMB 322]